MENTFKSEICRSLTGAIDEYQKAVDEGVHKSKISFWELQVNYLSGILDEIERQEKRAA